VASAPRSCPGVQIQRRRGWILRLCGELRRLPRPPRRGRACAASLPTPRSSSSRSPRWPPRAGTSLAPLHRPSVAASVPRSGLTDPDPALARVDPVMAWQVRRWPWPAALAYRAPDAALARMDPALRRRRPGQAQQLQRRRLPLAEEVGSRGLQQGRAGRKVRQGGRRRRALPAEGGPRCLRRLQPGPRRALQDKLFSHFNIREFTDDERKRGSRWTQ